MSDPKINSKGIKISIEVGIDLTAASTTLEIRYTDPDDEVGSFPGTYILEGGKHYVEYTTLLITDISISGTWKFEVYAVGPGFELYGTEAKQKFEDPMEGSF